MGVFLSIVFVTICILLMIVILLQKGRGGGLSGAFGGVGGHTAFGTKTGDVMTWTTVVLAALFLLSAVTLNLWFKPGREGDLGVKGVPTAPVAGDSGVAPAERSAETRPAEDTE